MNVRSAGSLPAALIFDMDGVLVDSNPYHLQKWENLLRHHQVPFDPKLLPRQILGAHNDDAFRQFFGKDLTKDELRDLSEEIESTFREVFAPHARPVPGLTALLEETRQAGITMAVASSAILKNVEFVVDVLGFRKYFQVMISGDEVEHPKPDPEIYEEAAGRLGIAPATCLAFEDSFVGVTAAKRAGMKCVAIGSSFPLEELRAQTQADLVVKGFEGLNLVKVRALFDGARSGEQQ
jgi:HAD superfamily hydrolase (TIGR01509 family)